MSAGETNWVWQIGRVVPGADDRLLIEFADPSSCSRCRSGNGCGAGQLQRLFGRGRPLRLPADTVAGLVPGARVRVGVDSRWLLTAAAIAYLLPLIAFVIGAVLAGPALGASDGAALAGGLAGVVFAWIIVRRLMPGLLNPRLHLGEVLESRPARNHLQLQPVGEGACRQDSIEALKE